MGLAAGRRSIASSMIGGLRETQEMLDFCSAHNIAADIELIAIEQINEAFLRLQRNDVKSRSRVD